MGLVLRISGRGTLALSIGGLTPGQADVLLHIIRSSNNGAGFSSAPFSSESKTACVAAASEAVFLTGEPGQFRSLLPPLAADPRLPPFLTRKIDSLLDNYLRSDYKIDCKGKVLDLVGRTGVMGILNVTPDSFSDGGRYAGPERALEHAREMTAAGADIIDIGGESTRPGAEPLPEAEELRRTIPVIERLSAELSVPISIDTYKSSVARKALEAGAGLVNDISGLRFSPDMAKVVADFGAAVVIMHLKGTPRDMQRNPVYRDVIGEIRDYLEEGVEIALNAGVDPERILIDPGIGFGKTLEHNLQILNRLDEFRAIGRPIVLGTSRKKFIGTVLDLPEPGQRADGTAATVALGIERGARVVRVHDVAPMARVARMSDAIIRAGD